MSHETDELSCSRTALDMDCTMVVVLEMGKFTWMLNPKFSSWGKEIPCQIVDVDPKTVFGNFDNG